MAEAEVPARYVGEHACFLKPSDPQRRFRHADGSPYQKSDVRINGRLFRLYVLKPGDTLMMPAREVLGFTMLHDRAMERPSLDLGVGHVVKAEHGALSWDELQALGYEFHQGRSDFELLGDPAASTPVQDGYTVTETPRIILDLSQRLAKQQTDAASALAAEEAAQQPAAPEAEETPAPAPRQRRRVIVSMPAEPEQETTPSDTKAAPAATDGEQQAEG